MSCAATNIIVNSFENTLFIRLQKYVMPKKVADKQPSGILSHAQRCIPEGSLTHSRQNLQFHPKKVIGQISCL